MSKATILSAYGKGQYRVQPWYNTARATAEIARIDAEIDAIAPRIETAYADKNTFTLEYDYQFQVYKAKVATWQNTVNTNTPLIAQGEIDLSDLRTDATTDNPDTAQDESEITSYEQNQIDSLVGQINLWKAEIDTALAEKDSAYNAVLSAATDLRAVDDLIAWLRLRQIALIKRKQWLQQYTEQPAEIDAWCADYTENLTGEVGTIEPGYQRRDTAQLIIRPANGEATGAAFSAGVDGNLTPVANQTPAQWAYNYALRPGAAKWKPRYRTGWASSIDTATNTMTVTLDDLIVDDISTNQATVLTAVPIEYMTCNATAFTNGDQVLVEFSGQDWSVPKVVGFVAFPRACEEFPWLLYSGFKLYQLNYTTNTLIKNYLLTFDQGSNHFAAFGGFLYIIKSDPSSNSILKYSTSGSATTVYTRDNSDHEINAVALNKTRIFVALTSGITSSPKAQVLVLDHDWQLLHTVTLETTNCEDISANADGCMIAGLAGFASESPYLLWIDNDGVTVGRYDYAQGTGFNGVYAERDTYYVSLGTQIDQFSAAFSRLGTISIFPGSGGFCITENKAFTVHSYYDENSPGFQGTEQIYEYDRTVTRDENGNFLSDSYSALIDTYYISSLSPFDVKVMRN